MSRRNKYIIDVAIDAEWFLKLKAIKRPLLLHSLEIAAESEAVEKSKILRVPGYNPTFTYKNLNLSVLNDAQEKLLNLRDDIVCQKKVDSSIQQVYLHRVEELLDDNSILLAAVTNDVDKFNIYNRRRFGELSLEIIIKQLIKLQKNYNLLSGLEFTKVNSSFDRVKLKKNITDIFKNWPSITTVDGLHSAIDVKKVWDLGLKEFAPDWEVVISSSVFHIRVNSKLRVILIPHNLKMRSERISAMFAHEIGTHVYRRINGKNSRLQLLSIGLAKYEKAEEGIALVRENSAVGVYALRGGFDKYLALAYSSGLIDGKPKDFNQTYSFLKEYYFVRHSSHHGSKEGQRLALNRAWLSTLRIFRGGNPSVPGNCFYRDKIYREGLFDILGLIEAHPEYFANSHLGKFDPGSASQRQVVAKFSDSHQ